MLLKLLLAQKMALVNRRQELKILATEGGDNFLKSCLQKMRCAYVSLYSHFTVQQNFVQGHSAITNPVHSAC